ncbi:hypothetical protein ARAM_002694 [Aspergillus rambellii]|uniref:Protein kinase domain-containing protein n=1 Tax=Aspergillus rambellii TaxID=308745 RepID=A0A0F8W2X4_9EURO|nr:hypothetical protein ARAM_002694 [Aspergillus rambellii]
MAGTSSPDYKALFLQEEQRRKQEEQLRKQEEQRRKQEEQRRKQAEGHIQPTTFHEFIRSCHGLFSSSLSVQTPALSTKGTIRPPAGKYCPTRLRVWEDCPARQQAIYDAVCGYLQPTGQDAPRLFRPLSALEDLSQRFSRRPISSEQDLESYERFAVEDHVHDVISELCKIPEAEVQFQLGRGVIFDNHANALDDADPSGDELLNPHRFRPDQFCIHRKNSNDTALLTTVEYKPPHKLSVENLRAGLQTMDFREIVVETDTTLLDNAEKLTHNAKQLVGSVLAQEYHVMIQEGLEFSYITNGLAQVLLHVPHDDPSTLYYYLCEPSMDGTVEDNESFQQPFTAIARVLCLCLMSFGSRVRDHGWRNRAQASLHIWNTSFDHIRAQIPDEELRQTPPNSGYTGSPATSSDHSGSEYLPSSPLDSPSGKARRMPTRSQPGCSPPDTINRSKRSDSQDSDPNPGSLVRKRGFSQVTSSPPTQHSARQTSHDDNGSGQYQQHMLPFCTQHCLLGLQQNSTLDAACPNIALHQHGHTGNRHPIDAKRLVELLKQQLDEDLDHNCTPFGNCGAYGAPFKITCATFGYTVVGKGTTTHLWKEVSREAEIYHILQKAQASAVPVFLGTIDLANIYFLHGAGKIRHMLLMAWGGESISKLSQQPALRHEISRSNKEIRALGVRHQDLRPDNILWNDELERVLIIDWHRSTLDPRPIKERMASLKKSLRRTEEQDQKRPRVI